MATLSFQHVHFIFDTPYVPIFEDLSLSLETHWKTALIGNNGRGKTTLLRLLLGELQPTAGTVSVPVEVAYFPKVPLNPQQPTLQVIRDGIAPFNRWEQQMESLLQKSDESSLAAYGDLQERYQDWQGYEIDSLIEKEMARLELDPLLHREFASLSGGEQTLSMLVAMFLKKDHFLLIDEPTNHLDFSARERLAQYLAEKSGFLLVSHDRMCLDACSDHVISLEKTGVYLTHGNYSTWKFQRDRERETEQKRNEHLKREIRKLEKAAQARRTWSNRKEKEKQGAADKGFVGHRAAKSMKRALNIERRVQAGIEEKKGLLRNVEKERTLKLNAASKAPELLLSVENLNVSFDERALFDHLSFTIHPGDRIALLGPNGSGKTTLFNAIWQNVIARNQEKAAGQSETTVPHQIGGDDPPIVDYQGTIHMPGYLQCLRTYQTPLWQTGWLRDHLRNEQLDETRFRQILGALGVQGNIVDRPLDSWSHGQLKKADLCRSLVSPAHLLLWDEPLNYIDLMARERLEALILEYQPTLLFIEHDQYFVENVATEVLSLEA